MDGFTFASQMGEVKFSGSAELIGPQIQSVNLKIPEGAILSTSPNSKTFVGFGKLVLPQNGPATIRLGGGYQINFPEGPSFPIPSRAFYNFNLH